MSDPKVYVPCIREFRKAENIRKQLHKQERQKLMLEEVQFISDAIKNHPGVKSSTPDSHINNEINEDDTIFRPLQNVNQYCTPLWYIKFGRAVSSEAFQYVMDYYTTSDDFWFDFAVFDSDGKHDKRANEHSCTIWKRLSENDQDEEA